MYSNPVAHPVYSTARLELKALAEFAKKGRVTKSVCEVLLLTNLAQQQPTAALHCQLAH